MITLKEFEQMVDEAVANLPEEFTKALSNVDIITEIWPNHDDLQNIPPGHGNVLFGLYRGIPKIRRGNYNAALPDKITIFAGPIVQVYGDNKDAIKRQVRETVLHEIGHHFGMTEAEIQSAQSHRKDK